MGKKNPYKTILIALDGKLQETKDAISNLKIFVDQITQQRNESLVKPLSVELRKLLSPYGRGNDLLFRIEQDRNIRLVFPDGTKTLPRTTVNVHLDDYRDRMIFAIGGRPVTRLDLICMVANEKGAHTDDVIDQMHAISEQVILPLGNPARDKLLFTQNTMYLLTIAKTVVKVVEEQLTK